MESSHYRVDEKAPTHYKEKKIGENSSFFPGYIGHIIVLYASYPDYLADRSPWSSFNTCARMMPQALDGDDEG
jgi:hypothetical protein